MTLEQALIAAILSLAGALSKVWLDQRKEHRQSRVTAAAAQARCESQNDALGKRIDEIRTDTTDRLVRVIEANTASKTGLAHEFRALRRQLAPGHDDTPEPQPMLVSEIHSQHHPV